MPQEKFPFLPYHTPRTRGLHLLGTALATSLSICLLPAEKGEVKAPPGHQARAVKGLFRQIFLKKLSPLTCPSCSEISSAREDFADRAAS